MKEEVGVVDDLIDGFDGSHDAESPGEFNGELLRKFP